MAGSELAGFFRPDGRSYTLFTTQAGVSARLPHLFACVHTNAQRVLLELWCEVGGFGQAEDVALQHVPAHLVEEGVAELQWNLRWKRQQAQTSIPFLPLHFVERGFTYARSVLDVTDVELRGDVEAVQEVSSKHHGVHRGVHRMNPT